MKQRKSFILASVSTGPNAFGLWGHVLIAEDGETWEVARVRSGGFPVPWRKGEVVAVPVSGDDLKPDWASLHCEVPDQLPDAPPNIVAELWGHPVVPGAADIPVGDVQPSVVFTAAQFVPTEWATSADKASFANAFVRFVENGFRSADFTPEFYNRLSNTFGHIAHFDRRTFFQRFFTTAANKLDFVRQTAEFVPFGQPSYTFSDVERALTKWVVTTGVLDRVGATAENAQYRAERELLRKLLQKHGTPDAG
jgi:hypothetical protein